jgi:protocatechuate 3,4-dioxygenase beta subunit
MTQPAPTTDAHLDVHDHDRGLSHDLPRLLSRRRVLAVLGGAGMAAILPGCRESDPGPRAPGGGTSSAAAGAIPAETAGPFPADGSNGANALATSGVVRSDIRASFGSATGVADGVPLTIRLRVLEAGSGFAGLEGAAVYVWHCDRQGRYSLYSEGVTEENYLRGVQAADADGWVTFESVYPGAYSGRWPHVHFEVYPSLDDATAASGKLRTSQLALPEDTNALVYARDDYGSSLETMAQSSLATDLVFGDGYSLQLAKTTGSVADGFTATLDVPV